MLSFPEAWRWVRGLLSREHAHTGKQAYGSVRSATNAKLAMERKTSRQFDVYRCPWRPDAFKHFHIGGTVRRSTQETQT